MKKTFVLILAILMTINAVKLNTVAYDETYSWYCVRAKSNLQPTMPGEFSFINEYNTLWLNSSVSDSDTKKIAYLTFDAGYENGNVEKVLDVLKDKNVPGAFFILINLIKSEPELIIRMVDEGHMVCNHTAYHKDITKFDTIEEFATEVDLLNNAFKDLTGQEMPKYFRPPEGKFNKKSLRFSSQLGYKTVFWSFAYADWDNANQPSIEFAKTKIISNIHNGAVLLLHPTSATNAAVLGDIIDKMREDGYEFGTLEDLFRNVYEKS